MSTPIVGGNRAIARDIVNGRGKCVLCVLSNSIMMMNHTQDSIGRHWRVPKVTGMSYGTGIALVGWPGTLTGSAQNIDRQSAGQYLASAASKMTYGALEYCSEIKTDTTAGGEDDYGLSIPTWGRVFERAINDDNLVVGQPSVRASGGDWTAAAFTANKPIYAKFLLIDDPAGLDVDLLYPYIRNSSELLRTEVTNLTKTYAATRGYHMHTLTIPADLVATLGGTNVGLKIKVGPAVTAAQVISCAGVQITTDEDEGFECLTIAQGGAGPQTFIDTDVFDDECFTQALPAFGVTHFLFQLGDNDGTYTEAWSANMDAVIARIRLGIPNAKFIFQTPPKTATATNGEYSAPMYALACKYDGLFLDMYNVFPPLSVGWSGYDKTWVTGLAWREGSVVYDATAGGFYMSKNAHTSTTRPGLDSDNWLSLAGVNFDGGTPNCSWLNTCSVDGVHMNRGGDLAIGTVSWGLMREAAAYRPGARTAAGLL
jgi:hypothetical protein